MAKATTSAPVSRAICTTHGAAPEPVPPPSPGTNKNHSRALHRFAQFVGGFLRRVIAQLGSPPAPSPRVIVTTELDFACRDRTGERLHVGVDRDHFGMLHPVEHDAVERVRAGASDADDFDREIVFLFFRQAVVAAELDHGFELSLGGPDCLDRIGAGGGFIAFPEKISRRAGRSDSAAADRLAPPART